MIKNDNISKIKLAISNEIKNNKLLWNPSSEFKILSFSLISVTLMDNVNYNSSLDKSNIPIYIAGVI